GRLRAGVIGQREDACLGVRVAMELDVRALLHIGIAALAEAPFRLLAVDDGPAQAALAVIGVERREVMAMAAAERGIFLEQALVDVEAVRLGLVVEIALLDIGDRKRVDLAVSVEHVEQRLAAVLWLL